jgi:hypothetical protein
MDFCSSPKYGGVRRIPSCGRLTRESEPKPKPLGVRKAWAWETQGPVA